MTSPEGAFYSAEDADSEGEEGLFYLWTEAELEEILGEEDAAFVRATFGTEPAGNFAEEATGERSGRNVLHLDAPLTDAQRVRWEPIRKTLFEAREDRIHPLKDDKILTDWNGLMIGAFARAGRAFGDEAYIERAVRAADFVAEHLRDRSGRLYKRYRGGDAGLVGMLPDYAYLADGLLDLFEAGHAPRHLAFAQETIDTALAHFWDDEHGGFFTTPDDGEELFVRAKEANDGARPSGNSKLAHAMARLARTTGAMEYEERARDVVKAFSTDAKRWPVSYASLLAATDRLLAVDDAHEIVVVAADGANEMLRALAKRYSPNDVLVVRPPGSVGDEEAVAKLVALVPYVRDQRQVDGKTTAYVCSNFTCEAPVTGVAEMVELLERSDDERAK